MNSLGPTDALNFRGLRALNGLMKRIALLLAVAATARAGGISMPPVGQLDFALADAGGTLLITPAADMDDVTVEIYGLDGLRVGADDMVWTHIAHLAKGVKVEVPFTLARGDGRTELVTFARAGGRQSQLTIVVGQESAEQRRRRMACVKQDADGRWIEEMGCPEKGPEPVVPRPGPTPTVVPGDPDIYVDGDRVLVEPRDLYIDGCASVGAERIAGDGVVALPGGPACPAGCFRPRRLDTVLPDGARGGKWRVEWRTFRDPTCREPAPVTLTIARAASPNRRQP
jgi:hypothetical protein